MYYKLYVKLLFFTKILNNLYFWYIFFKVTFMVVHGCSYACVHVPIPHSFKLFIYHTIYCLFVVRDCMIRCRPMIHIMIHCYVLGFFCPGRYCPWDIVRGYYLGILTGEYCHTTRICGTKVCSCRITYVLHCLYGR